MVRDDGKCELCLMLKLTQHEVRYGTVIRLSADLKGINGYVGLLYLFF